jgi:hypothetical protein
VQLAYGSYLFPVNATLLTSDIETLWNAGGQPYAQKKSIHVSGYLTTSSGTPQDDLSLQESALKTALALNFQDLVFFMDDALPSSEVLRNAGSITGVRIRDLHFPTTTGPEYATIRSFQFTAEAEYPYVGSQNLLLSFTETLTFSGGLPLFRHRLAINGPPQKQLVYPQDTFRAVQSGSSTGYRVFPVAPAPIWPYALKEAPRFTRTSPERKGKAVQGLYQGYGLTWQYEFEDAGPLVGFPTLWLN